MRTFALASFILHKGAFDLWTAPEYYKFDARRRIEKLRELEVFLVDRFYRRIDSGAVIIIAEKLSFDKKKYSVWHIVKCVSDTPFHLYEGREKDGKKSICRLIGYDEIKDRAVIATNGDFSSLQSHRGQKPPSDSIVSVGNYANRNNMRFYIPKTVSVEQYRKETEKKKIIRIFAKNKEDALRCMRDAFSVTRRISA